MMNMEDISQRKWWVQLPHGEIGPIEEEEFQTRLRAGEFALNLLVRSNFDQEQKRLVDVVTQDPTFRRTSMPPPPPEEDS
jgi:hypothetical protein